MKAGIAEVLQREGYIWGFEVVENSPRNILRVELKYGPNGEKVIQNIQRTSTPGCRIYKSASEIPKVLQGLGICVLSTNLGILSGREAKSKKVGGEILFTVY